MPDLPGHDGHPADDEPDSAFTLPAGRTLVVLLLFVVTTAFMLGKTHLGAATVSVAAPAATPSVTPTTAAGPAPTGNGGHAAATTTTTTTTPPSSVAVLVANGTNVTGLAGSIANQLHAAGWSTLPAANATTTVSASTIYYVSGRQGAAGAIAATLHVAPGAVVPLTSTVPVASVGAAQVVVIAGPDLASHAAATTTTTAAG